MVALSTPASTSRPSSKFSVHWQGVLSCRPKSGHFVLDLLSTVVAPRPPKRSRRTVFPTQARLPKSVRVLVSHWLVRFQLICDRSQSGSCLSSRTLVGSSFWGMYSAEVIRQSMIDEVRDARKFGRPAGSKPQPVHS